MTDTRRTEVRPTDVVSTEVLLTDALVRHWTRDPVKVGVLCRDTWFLESAEQLFEVTMDAARVGAGLATLLVKPDGIATGSARTVVDWVEEAGFMIHDAVSVEMDHNGIRALWYHQWNIASAERRLLADLLSGLSPALLLVVGRAGDRLGERAPASNGRPCAVDLTELKGPTAPHLRGPEHLRGRLPGGSYLLNQVHTADEPADAVRELGVYLGARRRRMTFERATCGHDASVEARRIADELDARFGGHSTEEGPAREALQPSRMPGESDAALCWRLLHSTVPRELEWPLLVAGAGCLPMRTPSGSVVLANPPASAWDTDRPRPSPRGGIDRSLVHRRADAETFVSGLGPAVFDAGRRRVVDATVQLARMHPVYTDHLGAQWGRADLLHLMEAVRQVCIGAGQSSFGARRRDVFVVRDFNGEFAGLPPQFDGAPLDLHVRLTAVREHRSSPDGPVTGLKAELDVTDRDGRQVGRCWGTYSWIPGSDFTRLRGTARDTLGLPTDASATSAGPPPEPVLPGEVLRLDPRGPVVSRAGRGAGPLELVVDTTHPVHFDHPLDHVPGMLQIEGARQAALLTLDPAARRRAVATRVESRFLAFAELDLPVTVRVASDDGGADGIRVELVQADRVVSDVTVVLSEGTG